MRSGGLLEPADEAAVVAAQQLASAVDANPNRASLWAEYREALKVLRSVGKAGDEDGFASLLADMRTAVCD